MVGAIDRLYERISKAFCVIDIPICFLQWSSWIYMTSLV